MKPGKLASRPTARTGRQTAGTSRSSRCGFDGQRSTISCPACHRSCLVCGIWRSRGPQSAPCLPSWKRAGTTVRQPAPHTSSDGPRPFGSPQPAHVLTALGETTFGLPHPPRDPFVTPGTPGSEHDAGDQRRALHRVGDRRGPLAADRHALADPGDAQVRALTREISRPIRPSGPLVPVD